MDYNKSMYAYMRAYREKNDEIAVVRGRRKTSFSALDKEIRRVAGGLYRLGVRKGDVVMCALPNIEQAVSLLYATSLLGGIFSPVHPLLAKAEFEKEVELQRPKVLVVSDVSIDFATLSRGAKIVYCPYWAHVYVGLPYSLKFEEYKGGGDIPALYMHSGGTSGAPKTVVFSAYSANALVHNLLSSIPYDFSDKDGMLVTLPLFHGFGLIVGVHASLCTNMKAVLVPKFSGERALKAIVRNRVTTMIAVPRMIRKLLDTDGFSGENVRTLENVYIGGDALDRSLAKEFNDRMKDAGAGAVAQQGYGLTEMGSVCVLSPKNCDENSVGCAISGVDTALVYDEEADGYELYLSSDQMMSGYLSADGKLESGCVDMDGGKWLPTGDLFEKKGEYLYYIGRKKRLIKISGMNVFPSEIERIAGEFDFVRAAAAFPIKINNKTYIKLLIEGDASEVQLEKVKKEIEKRLSHWHRPEVVECVKSLPRTNIGKIDFKNLK